MHLKRHGEAVLRLDEVFVLFSSFHSLVNAKLN